LLEPTHGYLLVYTRHAIARQCFKSEVSLLNGVEEVGQFVGGHFSLDEVAVGLLFDVGPDVFALFEVGGDNNLGL
jgi:hypothetical protein